MPTNMDPPPEEGNFCDDSKRAVKPQIVARYSRHMGYDISDRMAKSSMNVGPCHHGMARPQVADEGTASNKEGSCE